MPGFIASVFNPKTKKTTESEVDDLDGAKLRARTLKGIEPIDDQRVCICTVKEPDGTTWRMALRKKPKAGHPPFIWEKEFGE